MSLNALLCLAMLFLALSATTLSLGRLHFCHSSQLNSFLEHAFLAQMPVLQLDLSWLFTIAIPSLWQFDLPYRLYFLHHTYHLIFTYYVSLPVHTP